VSRAAEAVRSVWAALRATLGALLIAAAVGALAGAAWGLADEPSYVATASVLVVDRGADVDQLGAGVIGAGAAAGSEGILELARTDAVAQLAAAGLGDDLAGADLLARTEFSLAAGGSAIAVRSTAGSPDLAAAAADAFAAATVEVAAGLERRRLRRAEERVAERLAQAEPDSEQAQRLGERLEQIGSLDGLGPPLRIGAAAELPREPAGDRSVAGAALIGAAVAALLAVLLVGGRELRRRPVRTVGGLAAAAGAPVLAELGPRPTPLEIAGPLTIRPAQLGADRMQALVEALRLRRQRGAADLRTLAVLSPGPEEGRTSVALGLAVAWAGTGTDVAVVETDLRRPAFAEQLALADGPGLRGHLAGTADREEILQTVSIAAPGAGPGGLPSFDCIAAGRARKEPGMLLAGPRFGRLLDGLREDYQVVILDTAPLLVATDALLVAEAARAGLLVARFGVSRLTEVAELADRLPRRRLLGSVLVGAPHRGPGRRRLPLR
jgi:tyrosine-protein kinase Etk/Wzc